MVSSLAHVSDVIDDIASCIRSANTKELSKYFSSTVSMTLLNDEGIYSRVQAEIILRDFFGRNTPTGVKMAHRLDSNPSFRYVVLNLETSKDTYRVSYKLTNNENTFQVTEFRVESVY
ncbi:DUF4783 domain-containing protein [Parapedobacter sp. ISTM3]|uniref:DUF4783 domain-containing protein n=1 Tax=Parapedobacter luteus TaxID=623280 RepID=A0A1T5ARN1_9SPHI|nr:MULTISPECIES: DUF4783 domain-containing protein [Parapedobacter]MBK1441989.1 DUF4783 domain-containing protein [Parapedobacter sp. ISTM3]SKB37487.1 protein of unknown function [Parapedobacter luteus]